ncbi:MAG: hypothetical protein SGPRY_007342 [Prymnesium sp.]
MLVNEVQVQLDKMKAETKVQIDQMKMDSRRRVQNITANGHLEVTKLDQQKDALLAKLHAEALATGDQIKAEASKHEATVISAAELQAARNQGSAKELMAKAEGISAPYVEARKQYETRMRQIKVWRSLAANKELVVSGESNEELNTLMLCDAIMEGNPVGGETKSQAGLTLRVLSEMLILQRGSKVMLNLGRDVSE